MSFEEWWKENYTNLNNSDAMLVANKAFNDQQAKMDKLSLALKGYYPLNDFIQARGIDAKNLGRNYGDIAVDIIKRLEKKLEEAECLLCDIQTSEISRVEEYFKNKGEK